MDTNGSKLLGKAISAIWSSWGFYLGRNDALNFTPNDVTNIPVSKRPTSAGGVWKKKSRVGAFEQSWIFASTIQICIILWILGQKLFSYDGCLINGV